MTKLASMALLIAMVGVRTLALLALMKFLAVRFGTEGFGQLSQVLAVAALFSVLAGGGLTNGIVRNVAAANDAADRMGWIKAALPITACAALVLGLVVLLLGYTLGPVIFPGQDIGYVFVVIALVQAVVGFGNIALAYLSGTGNLRAFTFANGFGSIAAAALVALLAHTAGFQGAVIGCAALALLPAIVGIIATARSLSWRELRAGLYDRSHIKTLLRYGGSMYLAAAAVPLVWVYIRSDLALRVGWDAVGLWQSVTRISDAYMQVFGILFIHYALPQLAAAAPSHRLRKLRDIGLVIFVLFTSGAAVLYLFSGTILTLAFSPAFAKATVYLAPQIIGDAFKLGSLLFVYYLVSLNRAAVQAWLEVLQAVLIVTFYALFTHKFGDLAAVISYAMATFLIFLMTLLFAARDSVGTER